MVETPRQLPLQQPKAWPALDPNTNRHFASTFALSLRPLEAARAKKNGQNENWHWNWKQWNFLR
jgi:hypothetical protein